MALDVILFGLVFMAVGGLVMYGGFRRWQQYRLVQDTATETVRAAAVGRTELKGTVRPLDGVGTIARPFTDGDCLVAEYEIEEYESDDDGSNWNTIDSGTRLVPFAIDDGTGQMRVEPDSEASYEFRDEHTTRMTVGGSEKTPEDISRFLRNHTTVDVQGGGVSGMLFGERRRYTERVLPPDADLYLLGGTEAAADASGVDAERLVFGRDESSGEFIVSTKGESGLVSSYKWQAPGMLLFGLVFAVVGLWVLLGVLGIA